MDSTLVEKINSKKFEFLNFAEQNSNFKSFKMTTFWDVSHFEDLKIRILNFLEFIFLSKGEPTLWNAPWIKKIYYNAKITEYKLKRW